MFYRVQWSYQSGHTAALGGLWRAGQMVDLPDALALAIGADSPGVLVAVPGYVLPDPGQPERAIDAAPSDRMAKAPGRTRKAGA